MMVIILITVFKFPLDNDYCRAATTQVLAHANKLLVPHAFQSL